jgi:hypothetical protein
VDNQEMHMVSLAYLAQQFLLLSIKKGQQIALSTS